jgi:hypothetical protein
MTDLASKIQYLIDRQEIQDCVYRYTRGLDRHDDEILASTFHPDAIDNHGSWVGQRDEFVRWANYQCHSHLSGHMHHITSHTCSIDGETADSETYVIFVHRYKDGKTVHVAGGRYLDQFEKRDGEWRISVRRLVVDYRYLADGSIFGDWDGYPKGTQGTDDLSYERPTRIPDGLLPKGPLPGNKVGSPV